MLWLGSRGLIPSGCVLKGLGFRVSIVTVEDPKEKIGFRGPGFR